MIGTDYTGAVSLLMAKGRHTLIDAADLPAVEARKWFTNPYGYAVSTPRTTEGSRSPIYLHRLLLDAPKGSLVDHINDDPLDNRRSNLRVCTASENVANGRKARGKSSRFKGVSFHKRHKRWRAYITVHQQEQHLGWFGDEEAAALAYNRAAVRLFGEFARLNRVEGDRFELTEADIRKTVAALEAERGRGR
ncbi:MAG: HNH endonuclease [Gemmataceae bacterium]|nr:HNH endonuclease [Gemmataceae bacterium]